MKFIPILLAALLSLYAAPGQARSFVEEHVGNATIHGLREIDQASTDFVAAYNQEHGTTWRSLGPNAKLMVSRCLVPFKMAWSPPASRVSTVPAPTDWRVKITCDKTVANSLNIKRWETLIPTTRRD
jgi:hypothetical protein